MDDSLLMGGLERIHDLPRDHKCLGYVQRSAKASRSIRTGWSASIQASVERFAVDELQHQELRRSRFFKTVDCADVRMIQRGEELRLALEARHALGIGDEELRQDLDGDVATELRVARFIDFAHPARAERGEDVV